MLQNIALYLFHSFMPKCTFGAVFTSSSDFCLMSLTATKGCRFMVFYYWKKDNFYGHISVEFVGYDLEMPIIPEQPIMCGLNTLMALHMAVFHEIDSKVTYFTFNRF